MGARVGLCFACAIALLAGMPTAAQAQVPAVTSNPALYPAFDPAVPDYVVRCTNGSPVNVNVTAPAGTQVDVDGTGPRSGTFSIGAPVRAGQSFGITRHRRSRRRELLRALPAIGPAALDVPATG